MNFRPLLTQTRRCASQSLGYTLKNEHKRKQKNKMFTIRPVALILQNFNLKIRKEKFLKTSGCSVFGI